MLNASTQPRRGGGLAPARGERLGEVGLPAVLDDGDAVLAARHPAGDGLDVGVGAAAEHEIRARLAEADDADRAGDAAAQRRDRLGDARRRPADLSRCGISTPKV